MLIFIKPQVVGEILDRLWVSSRAFARLSSPPGRRNHRNHLWADTHVVSDGLNCFTGITTTECTHEAIITGGGPASVNHEAFTWVNTMLGNVKNAIQGIVPWHQW